MQSLSLPLLLLASAVNGAVVRRADCNGTVTTTVTPAAVTTSTYTNLDVFYTTTAVTAYAMNPTPAGASPSISADAISTSSAANTTSSAITTAVQAPACDGATTMTEFAATPTTTLTTTYTFSHAARATVTLAACQPSTNYGLFNGSLDVNYVGPIGEPNTQTFPAMSVSDCCSECFTSAAGCLSWSFNGAGSCSMSVVDGGCPGAAGHRTETIQYPNDEKPAIGVGSCNVVVSYFQEG